MKEIKILILVIITFIANILNSQNVSGEITYKKDFFKSFSELNQKLKKQDLKRFEEYNDMWENQRRLVLDIEFSVLFNKNESTFKVKDYIDQNEGKLNLRLPLGIYASSIYYNNLLSDVYYRQAEAYGEKFLIEMPKINWKQVDLSENINGYLCFKAVSKTNTMGRNGNIEREVIAWYTNDIPISFGPIGFAGLPGLIIKLVYDNEVYIVSKIDLNPIKKVIIKRPNKGIKVTKIEFEKIGLEKMSNYKKMF